MPDCASGLGNRRVDVENLAVDVPHLDLAIRNLVREVQNRDVPVPNPVIAVQNPVIAVSYLATLPSGTAVSRFGTAAPWPMTSRATLGTATARSDGSRLRSETTALRSGTTAPSFPTAHVRHPFPIGLITPPLITRRGCTSFRCNQCERRKQNAIFTDLHSSPISEDQRQSVFPILRGRRRNETLRLCKFYYREFRGVGVVPVSCRVTEVLL